MRGRLHDFTQSLKVYIVSFRTHNDDRPSKFIVVADNRKEAIQMAWEHGGADFQARFDKSTTQAQEMKVGALRVL
jgi:NADPH-dependent 7-cyano-7-deazaguanine reductase QueF